MKLSPDTVITFVKVVEYGSISAAADIMHLTQPAVSNQLRLLQDRLGQPLYRRSGRGIKLTSFGELFYEKSHRWVIQWQQIENIANALKDGDTGKIHISASLTIGAYLLPTLISEFKNKYPKIEIELDSQNTNRVIDHLPHADLVMLEGFPHGKLPKDFVIENLGTDEIVALFHRNHPLANKAHVSLKKLANETLIWREQGSATRDQIEKAFLEQDMQPEKHIVLAGISATKEAVRRGLGVGFSSRLAIRSDPGTLIGVSLRPRITRKLFLVTTSSRSSATQRFLDFLGSRLRASPVVTDSLNSIPIV